MMDKVAHEARVIAWKTVGAVGPLRAHVLSHAFREQHARPLLAVDDGLSGLCTVGAF